MAVQIVKDAKRIIRNREYIRILQNEIDEVEKMWDSATLQKVISDIEAKND